MIKQLLLIVVVGVAAGMRAQDSFYSLVKGNDLNTWCKAYERVIHVEGEHSGFATNDLQETRDAAECMGYVFGIVDSTPVNDSFTSNAHVRGTQYVDVAVKYLHAHPELLHEPARHLVQEAIRESFHKSAAK
jgi:hypothetical protein